MTTKQTLEVRWFIEGQLPNNIKHWFWDDCPGQLHQRIESPETREDLYLYLPKCQILSFKFRQKNLEIKWRKDEFGIEKFLSPLNLNSYNYLTDWKGKVERWLKLEYCNETVKDKLDVEHKQNQTWINVQKQRWQRIYKQVEFEISSLKICQTNWWTIAAEMEEKDKNSEQDFYQAIKEFSQTYSHKNLSPEQSYAYPSWLIQNFSD
ncbi:hypothetical protein PCC7424_1075 [Gloeothece citriformis PCC 7424]|uniref:Uncharacterized protein n=1 Tax=Gloeothece citriformis (strain PCC 7424) TaxID=65393 RepID=B7KJS9_GLOC7|nr:hypothetical protein [Gloeothece citriformis]ACK69528.1 hypothetical protein PCC7424_1075 [Gloeothece citriformis PCC 7424]